MPILESKTDRSGVRRTLVATGLGAIFGFQTWRLAEYGFAASIPWYGSLWIFLSHLLLGCSVGATAGFTPWWKRGWVLGLFFSIPAAVGTHAPGLKHAPYGLALMTSGLIAGLLVAFLTDTLLPGRTASPGQHRPAPQRSSGPEIPATREFEIGGIRQRLSEGKACLENLDVERRRQHDSAFGRATEDRVVWGELLELELQEIDEQVRRICNAAGNVAGTPREHWWIDKHLHKRRSS